MNFLKPFLVPRRLQKVITEFLKIVFGTQEATNVITVTPSVLEKAFQSLEYTRKSEVFLIEAVRNFIRKINFSELNESLEENEISEEEYNLALENNSDKYAITLQNLNSPADSLIIADLVDKIGYELREFSTSEVAEMFSVEGKSIV